MKRLLLFFAVIVAFSFQLPGTCTYIFTTGIPCTNQSVEGSQYCSQHQAPSTPVCHCTWLLSAAPVKFCSKPCVTNYGRCAEHAVPVVPPLQ